MKVEDWYTPERGMASYESVSPAMITYKEKQFVVVSWRRMGPSLYSMRHRLAEQITTLRSSRRLPISKPGEKHGWDGFASWQDKERHNLGIRFHLRRECLCTKTPSN